MLLVTLLGAFSLPETFEIDRVWEGRVEIDQSTCISGEIVLALEAPAEDGSVRGSYFYTSDRTGKYKANYVVEGQWEDDVLHLRQVGIDVVAETTTTTWRNGTFELKQRGDSLSGRWESFDSPCAGQISLVEQ